MVEIWRKDSSRRRREEIYALDPVSPPGVASDVDDTLALVFLCCHPELTVPSQVALTLRALGGLTTAEIARALLLPEANLKNPTAVLGRADATLSNADVTLGRVDETLSEVSGTLGTVDTTLGKVSDTLGTVDATLAADDSKLGEVSATLTVTGATMGQVKDLLSELKSKLDLLDQVPEMASKLDEILRAVSST